MNVERIQQAYTRIASRHETQRAEANHKDTLTADAVSSKGQKREQRQQQNEQEEKENGNTPEKQVLTEAADETAAATNAVKELKERLDVRV